MKPWWDYLESYRLRYANSRSIGFVYFALYRLHEARVGMCGCYTCRNMRGWP